MKVIKPSYKIRTKISEGGIEELKNIEEVARICYKSEDRITEDGESAKKMVKMLIDRGHEAMLEHSQLSVLFICDRGVSHEIVRHRLASYAQESTRYCNYSNDRFGNEITVIEPYTDIRELSESHKWLCWYTNCQDAEKAYFKILNIGGSPQEARSVLPTCLKTELIMTTNYREWRHFLKLRTAPDAHPQIRQLAAPLLVELHDRIPIVFDDIFEESILHNVEECENEKV